MAVLTFTNCKKTGDIAVTTPTDPGTPAPITGVVRPVGVSTGPLVTEEVGAAGGTVTTPGGAIVITIPAGALTETTSIGIEPITNTNLAGIGAAYRLTPHGQHFAKPVAITFNYTKDKNNVSLQTALGLAYQDNTGIWKFMSAHVIDTSAKKVTYNSTHFSDWSLMDWLVLNPFYAVLGEDEELDITAQQYIPLTPKPIDDEKPPVTDDGYPVGVPTALEKKYIKEWKLDGPGFLIAGNDNFASYKAPANIPVSYSATVSLQLNSTHTIILVSNIQLLSKDNFEWRFNGGDWQKEDAKLVSLGADKLAIAFVEGERRMSMFWPVGVNFFAWGDDDSNTGFNYFPNGAATAYMSSFDIDNVSHPSGGGITITQMGKVGEYVAGSFSIEPSGYYSSTDGKEITMATIEGRFKLKRY